MEAKDRKLPIPYFVGGMPMNEVIAKRQSIRQFNPSRPVTDFELGQALWMALGINRLVPLNSNSVIPPTAATPPPSTGRKSMPTSSVPTVSGNIFPKAIPRASSWKVITVRYYAELPISRRTSCSTPLVQYCSWPTSQLCPKATRQEQWPWST